MENTIGMKPSAAEPNEDNVAASVEQTCEERASEEAPNETSPPDEKELTSGEQLEVQTEDTQQEEALSAEEVSRLLTDLAEAQEKAAKLTEEKRLLHEQLLRRQAEFENFRKRTERERSETVLRARADIINEMLPILDNFERALSSVNSPDDAVQEGILTGIRLIHRQFLDCLIGMGLNPIQAVGEPFDPHLHEAVTTEVTADQPENTILEELRRGYKLGDKLIRPSMVKVSVRE